MVTNSIGGGGTYGKDMHSVLNNLEYYLLHYLTVEEKKDLMGKW